MKPQSWQANIERILADEKNGSTISRTLNTTLKVILPEEGWDGGCYAIASVVHLLMREQGIDSVLCLGEVGFDSVVFDHGWIELDGSTYDIAIAKPLEPVFAYPPVVKGLDVETLGPTRLHYGVTSGFPADSQSSMVLSTPFRSYMDGFPGHAPGLWGIVADIGKSVGLRLRASDVRKQHRNVQWTPRKKR